MGTPRIKLKAKQLALKKDMKGSARNLDGNSGPSLQHSFLPVPLSLRKSPTNLALATHLRFE